MSGQTGKRLRHLCLTLLLCAGLASPTTAETKALLIGVSDYDAASGVPDLRGPANDVRLLRQVLARRGVEDIIVLSEATTRPTRAAILDAFAAVAAEAGPGDFIYIHFSGHGTQQRDVSGDESDGRDEVFLPADTRPAQGASGLIGNAITDDEIGEMVDAIRANGADVWLVLDSCHSGSGLRGGAADVALRYVDPALLGVGPLARNTAEPMLPPSSLPPGAGGIIAFYAAQSHEVAREVNLAPQGAPDAWYGLFTAHLAARLDTGEALSFRQLFQAIMQDMNGQAVPGGARLQTPLWQGDLIDAALFGGGSTVGLRRFAVRGDRLSAGLVHGLTTGTLLGLVGDSAAPADALIGTAQIEASEALGARLRPVADDCIAQTETLCSRIGALPSQARFAQVLARPVGQIIGLALPIDLASRGVLAADHPAMQALTAAIDAADLPLALSATDYDVETLWDGQKLWFGPRALAGQTPVGLSWSPGNEALEPLLRRVVRAEHLAQMLAAAARNTQPLSPNPLRIEARLTPVALGDLVSVATGMTPQSECRAARANLPPGAGETLPPHAALKQCDGLSFLAQSASDGARDVNRVHIDAQYCVYASYERVVGRATAQIIGPNMTLCSDCPSGFSAGHERLFVITSQARANSEALNLVGHIETCGDTAPATRGAQQAQIAAFLEALPQGRALRRNMGGIGIANIWVEQFDWLILPKPELPQLGDRP